MNQIKRISLFFRVFFQFILIGLPMLFIFSWVNCPQSIVMFGGVINMSFVPHSYANHILHTLSGSDKLLGALVSTAPLSIALFIVYSLVRLFKLYEQGEIFSLENVRYIRHVAYALLVGQMINPFYELAMGYVLTRNNPTGHAFASITLDQTNIGIILTALLVILISWVMAEGCKLREEQQLTI